MNKKLKHVLFTMGVIFSLGCTSAYADDINVYLHTPPITSLYSSDSYFGRTFNAEQLNFSQNPFIQNNRLFVPLREFCDKTGCNILWDEATSQAKVTRGFKNVVFTINSNKILVNNIQKTIDVVPLLINGKTFVPLRVLIESLGNEIIWSSSDNVSYVGILEKDKSYINGDWNTVVDLTKNYTNTSTNGSSAYVKVCVPQILNASDSSAIDKINEYYREQGRDKFSSYQKMCAEDLACVPNKKLTYEMSYSIGYNANDILSVKRLLHCDRAGVHPSYEFVCDTFDTNTAQKLYIDDILNGSKEEIYEFLVNKFSKMIDENDYKDFEKEMKSSIKSNIDKVLFYLDGDELVFFFNPYVVAPYCVGTPKIEINIRENSLLFKRKFIDKTNYEEELKILDYAKNYSSNPQIVDKTTINDTSCYVIQCDDSLIAIDRNCENVYKLTKNTNSYKILDTKCTGLVNNLTALKLVMNRLHSSNLCYDIGGTLHDDNGEYIIVAIQNLDENVISKLAVNKKTGDIFSYFFEEKFPEKIESFSGEYYFLSNSFEAPVTYNGLVYKNNEAAFWAQRCINSDDKSKFTILNPKDAKNASIFFEPRKDWDDTKLSVMKDIVRAKFLQNSDLAKKLLSTGNAHIEYTNDANDTFFGTVNGQGENYLGKILMDVRSELIKMKS